MVVDGTPPVTPTPTVIGLSIATRHPSARGTALATATALFLETADKTHVLHLEQEVLPHGATVTSVGFFVLPSHVLR